MGPRARFPCKMGVFSTEHRARGRYDETEGLSPGGKHASGNLDLLPSPPGHRGAAQAGEDEQLQ